MLLIGVSERTQKTLWGEMIKYINQENFLEQIENYHTGSSVMHKKTQQGHYYEI